MVPGSFFVVFWLLLFFALAHFLKDKSTYLNIKCCFLIDRLRALQLKDDAEEISDTQMVNNDWKYMVY